MKICDDIFRNAGFLVSSVEVISIACAKMTAGQPLKTLLMVLIPLCVSIKSYSTSCLTCEMRDIMALSSSGLGESKNTRTLSDKSMSFLEFFNKSFFSYKFFYFL